MHPSCLKAMERWRWGDRIERRELEEVGSKEANAAVEIRCAASVRQGGMRHQMRRLQGRRGLFNWHGSSKEATTFSVAECAAGITRHMPDQDCWYWTAGTSLSKGHGDRREEVTWVRNTSQKKKFGHHQNVHVLAPV